MNNFDPVIHWTAEAVKLAIADSGKTKVAIADETGIAYSTLNRKLSGKTEFLPSELAMIAEVTNTHPSQFIAPYFQPQLSKAVA